MSEALPRVLCVDDEPHLLEAVRRTLGPHFDLTTAMGGTEGLNRIQADPPYAVVVSDLRMPGFDGISLLHAAAEHSPDTIRILLTGNGDFQSALDAINSGSVFRMLTKPCPSSVLRRAIEAGVRQHELVTSERVLLSQTLRGAVRSLAELVALVHPAVGAQTSRVRRTTVRLAEALGVPNVWEIEISALLSNLGSVTLPEPLIRKLQMGSDLLTHEQRMLGRVPEVTADVVAYIPRLEGVRQALLAQHVRWDGGDFESSGPKGEAIPLAARIVKLATDLDLLESRGMPRARALTTLESRTGWYDPALLAKLVELELGEGQLAREERVTVSELKPGMILAEDLLGHEGTLMVARGGEVSRMLVSRIREYWDDELKRRVVRVVRANDEPGDALAA